MNRRAVLFFLLGGPAGVLLPVQAGTSVSLGQLVEQALTGPAVQEAAARIDQARAGEGEARAALKPQAGLVASTWQWGSDPGYLVPQGALFNPAPLELVMADRRSEAMGVSVEQLVWDGGRASRTVAAARGRREAAELEQAMVVELVKFQVVQAAFAWDRDSNLCAAARAGVAEKEALVKQVSAFLAQEQIPRADLLQAEAAAAMARHHLASAEVQRARSQAALERLTGSSLQGVEHLEWPTLPDLPQGPSEELAEKAADKRPAAAALKRASEAAREAAQAVRATWRPSLVLEARAERMDDSYQLHPNNAQLALTARVPLATGGRIAAKEKRFLATALGLEAEVEAARRGIREQVISALAEDHGSQIRLDAARAALQAAEEAYRSAQARYREGLIGGRELIDAEEDLAQARDLFAAATTGRAASRFLALLALGEPWSSFTSLEIQP